jgi:multidrug efflux pump subunit AcrB
MLALGSCVPLGKAVPKGFLPKSDEARFEIEVRAPEGTSLDATALVAERIAREVRALPGIETTVLTVGDNNEHQANVATVYVGMTNPKRRALSQDATMDRVRKEIAPHAPEGTRVHVYEVALIGGGGSQGATIAYVLTGPDLGVLGKEAGLAKERLSKVPGAADVETSLVVGKPELDVRVDRDRAADLGVDLADVASTLRLLVGGQDVSTFEDKGESYEIHVRAAAGQRASAADLELLTVPRKGGGTVPLLDVARVRSESGPSQIERLNRKREVLVTANVAPGHAEGEVTAAFEREVAAMHLPAGYSFEATGRSREMGRAASGFLLAFGLSFVFMYLILAAQFESWLHPITILLGLPLTVPFALLSLLFFGQALDIYSCLGVLVLFGVVKKNAILQIEHTNQLRRDGMPRAEAILRANKDRLRPILMTTIAFVAGMLPLVTSRGIGAGFNQATAGVIVGGQVMSLALTLLATPVAYTLLDDLVAWVKARLPAKTPTLVEQI